MDSVPADIKLVIDDLADIEKALSHSKLVDLSNLSSTEADYLAQVWNNIELSRRRKIINRMVELAEENF